MMLNNFFEGMLNEINLSEMEIRQLSPLVLAYMGDAVYEVYIRTLLVTGVHEPVHKLHKKSTEYVKAKAQSDIIHRIMDSLTPEEQDVVRRGRNAKSGTIPKNADVTDYKYATGYESLIGFLYLSGSYDRMEEILKMSVAGEKNRE